jgi:hypothetical protein
MGGDNEYKIVVGKTEKMKAVGRDTWVDGKILLKCIYKIWVRARRLYSPD